MSRYQYILNTFGMRAIKPLFYRGGDPLEKHAANYPEGQPADVEKFDTYPDGIQKMSMLGTPVFSDIVLRSPDGRLKIELDAALCEVTQKNVIVTTKIIGRNGSVKEYINSDDYQLKIKGILFENERDVAPMPAIKALDNMGKINDSVAIVSPFLDVFGIRNIVITEIKTDQIEGKLNCVKYEITAMSDMDLSIIVND